MSTHTGRQKPNIAAGNVTANIVFARKVPAQHAAGLLPLADDFATRNAGAGIGTEKKARDTSGAALDIGRGNLPCSKLSAASVYIAAMMTRACLTSTTSTRAKRTNPLIAATQRLFDWPCGRKKWITCKSFARIAIASKPIVNTGAPTTFCADEPKYFDIACRRIADEVARPRLPLDEPAPKHEAML